jgi:hypothetical protein
VPPRIDEVGPAQRRWPALTSHHLGANHRRVKDSNAPKTAAAHPKSMLDETLRSRRENLVIGAPAVRHHRRRRDGGFSCAHSALCCLSCSQLSCFALPCTAGRFPPSHFNFAANQRAAPLSTTSIDAIIFTIQPISGGDLPRHGPSPWIARSWRTQAEQRVGSVPDVRWRTPHFRQV